jgi:hypothetical protein
MGDGAKKVVTFLKTFLKRKTVFWAILSLFEASKGGGGQKAVKTRLYQGKGYRQDTLACLYITIKG